MSTAGTAGQSERRLGPVLDLLYDAVFDDSKWHGIAASVADAFGCSSAVLKTCGGPGGPQLASVTDNLRISRRDLSWADYWHRNDLWVERSAQLPLCEAFTSQGLMPDAQFERTGFYQDWTRRLDIYHMVGVLFPTGRGEMGVLGAHRPLGAGPFDEAERLQLQALFPHVRRVLGLRERTGRNSLARVAALEAIERIETGVVVVDGACCIRYANHAADALLSTSNEIVMHGGRLRLDDLALNNRLQSLVRQAEQIARGLCHLPGTAMVVPRPDRLPITLLVSPWRAEWSSADIPQPAAMIFIRAPETSASVTDQALRALFGLTRAEAVIAIAVAEGHSLEHISVKLGVGLGTVRTHVKKALVKTGTSRQAALAALVARSVAGISDPA